MALVYNVDAPKKPQQTVVYYYNKPGEKVPFGLPKIIPPELSTATTTVSPKGEITSTPSYSLEGKPIIPPKVITPTPVAPTAPTTGGIYYRGTYYPPGSILPGTITITKKEPFVPIPKRTPEGEIIFTSPDEDTRMRTQLVLTESTPLSYGERQVFEKLQRGVQYKDLTEIDKTNLKNMQRRLYSEERQRIGIVEGEGIGGKTEWERSYREFLKGGGGFAVEPKAPPVETPPKIPKTKPFEAVGGGYALSEQQQADIRRIAQQQALERAKAEAPKERVLPKFNWENIQKIPGEIGRNIGSISKGIIENIQPISEVIKDVYLKQTRTIESESLIGLAEKKVGIVPKIPKVAPILLTTPIQVTPISSPFVESGTLVKTVGKDLVKSAEGIQLVQSVFGGQLETPISPELRAELVEGKEIYVFGQPLGVKNLRIIFPSTLKRVAEESKAYREAQIRLAKESPEIQGIVEAQRNLGKQYQEGKISYEDYLSLYETINSGGKVAKYDAEVEKYSGYKSLMQRYAEVEKSPVQLAFAESILGVSESLPYLTPLSTPFIAAGAIKSGEAIAAGRYAEGLTGAASTASLLVLRGLPKFGRGGAIASKVLGTGALGVFGGISGYEAYKETGRISAGIGKGIGTIFPFAVGGIVRYERTLKPQEVAFERVQLTKEMKAEGQNLLKNTLGIDLPKVIGTGEGKGQVYYSTSGRATLWYNRWQMQLAKILPSYIPKPLGIPAGAEITFKTGYYYPIPGTAPKTKTITFTGTKESYIKDYANLYERLVERGARPSTVKDVLRTVYPTLKEAKVDYKTRIIISPDKGDQIVMWGPEITTPLKTKTGITPILTGKSPIEKLGISATGEIITGGQARKGIFKEYLVKGMIKNADNKLANVMYEGIRVAQYERGGKYTAQKLYKIKYAVSPQQIARTFISEIGEPGYLFLQKTPPVKIQQGDVDEATYFQQKEITKQIVEITPLGYKGKVEERILAPVEKKFYTSSKVTIKTQMPPEKIYKITPKTEVQFIQGQKNIVPKEELFLEAYKLIPTEKMRAKVLGTEDVFLESYQKISSTKILDRPIIDFIGLKVPETKSIKVQVLTPEGEIKTLSVKGLQKERIEVKPLSPTDIYKAQLKNIKENLKSESLSEDQRYNLLRQKKLYEGIIEARKYPYKSIGRPAKMIVGAEDIPGYSTSYAENIVQTELQQSLALEIGAMPIPVAAPTLTPITDLVLSPMQQPLYVPKITPRIEPALRIEPTVRLEPAIIPIVQPKTEVKVEAIPQPTPTVEPIIEPIVQPIIEPIVQPIIEPIVEPIIEPIITPTPSPFPALTPPGYPERLTGMFLPPYERRKRKEKKRVPAYQVLIKRRGKFIPVKAGLPRGLALRYGTENIIRNLGRTFKIAQSGTTDIPDIEFMPSPRVFRQYKVKKGIVKQLPGDIFIQKQISLLQTPEEKMEIARQKKIMREVNRYA